MGVPRLLGGGIGGRVDKPTFESQIERYKLHFITTYHDNGICGM